MKQEIIQALKNVGAFLAAFVLPLVLFTVIVVDAHWFLPFIVCPALMVGAAMFTQGHKGITKWVKWSAAVGVLYAVILLAAN